MWICFISLFVDNSYIFGNIFIILLLRLQIPRRRGRNSSVGITTRYGLGYPGIESRLGRDFPHPSRPALGACPASFTMGTGSFPKVKRLGRGVDHPLPSSAEVEGRVELYIYFHYGPSWPVLGRTLPLHLPIPRRCKVFRTVLPKIQLFNEIQRTCKLHKGQQKHQLYMRHTIHTGQQKTQWT